MCIVLFLQNLYLVVTSDALFKFNILCGSTAGTNHLYLIKCLITCDETVQIHNSAVCGPIFF